MQQRGYSREEMSAFTTVYYLVADVGSWTCGIVTLVLCKRGMRVHVSRLLAFAGCALLTVCTVSVPFLPGGWVQKVLLLASFVGGGVGIGRLVMRHKGHLCVVRPFGRGLMLSTLYYAEEQIAQETLRVLDAGEGDG